MTDNVDPSAPRHPVDEPEGALSMGPPPRVGAGDPNARPAPTLTTAEPDETPPSDDGEGEGEGDDDFDIPDRRSRGVERQLRSLLEWVAVAVGALAVALLIKAFLLQAFYIPSASMEPTLSDGDRVLVNKLSYRFGDVGRGDVVVFEKPELAGGDIDDLIKRVIGLEGETITLVDGGVFVDGVRLDEPYIEADLATRPKNAIPNCVGEPVNDSCSIPDGFVFVMGDNRDHSTDSRIFGPIDEDSIVGRAFLKVWPLTDLGFL